jgi:hypothetical protein
MLALIGNENKYSLSKKEAIIILTVLIAGIGLLIIPALVNSYFGYLLLRAKK